MKELMRRKMVGAFDKYNLIFDLHQLIKNVRKIKPKVWWNMSGAVERRNEGGEKIIKWRGNWINEEEKRGWKRQKWRFEERIRRNQE
jgi:hypothetical protein